MRRSFVFYIAVGLAASACSRVPLADDGMVSCQIENRIESEVYWRQGCDAGEEVEDYILCALNSELTANAAIQIALLNSPKIQAVFEEIGIAQAGLVEAGLLSNPVFGVEVRYPHIRGLKTNIEYLITSSLLDFFLIPLRTRLAETELQQAKLKVSNEILHTAFEVRDTYYRLVADKKKIEYLESLARLAGIQRDITRQQIAIGNINTLESERAQARFLEAENELASAKAELIGLNEKLYKLLGFRNDVCLILPDHLDEEDNCHFDVGLLESIALSHRLDIQIAWWEILHLSRMLGLKEGWTYTNLSIGLAGERDPDGTNLIGPGFSGEIPIFNYGQAAHMRLFAQLRQASERLKELEVQVLSEVREANKLLMTYLKIIEDYQNRLLPMQNKISASSEALYNVMGLGVDRLLESKREQLIAIQNYTEIRKKYLIARVELDRALGGNLYRLLAHQDCILGDCE